MNVLLIGHGAREHAIAKVVRKSRHVPKLFTYGKTKNPGIFYLSEEYYVGDLNDFTAIKEFALTNKVDFAIIGPEDPIAAGLADCLEKENIPVIAPLLDAAQLEASKSFTRNLLKKYQIIGNPKFKVFDKKTKNVKQELKKFFVELNNEFVVKYDALYGGKGVKVSGAHLNSVEEGIEYAIECINLCGKVVIEEKLEGEEFSLIEITDGNSLVRCPVVQDHKRAYENDEGPNTGGMGSYSDANFSLPFLNEEDIKEAHQINEAVVQALYQEIGKRYKGILYGGFIKTAQGVKLIEYNVRFGDPEVMNILPILKVDFVDLCFSIINENLKQLSVAFEKLATVCKYVVPQGYPDKPVKNKKIELGPIPPNCEIFYGAVHKEKKQLIMDGSRAIAFVGKGKNLAEAEMMAQKGVESVSGPVFFRKDIGTAELIQKRINNIKN